MSAPHESSHELEGLPVQGQILASKFEVERVLGVGGMGVVVAARHLHLGHRVAIKFIRGAAARDGASVARFLREARAVLGIRSEHVTKVLDVGTLETGAPYIVMEYLDGTDLSEVVQANGPLGVEQAVGLVLQGCEAIAEAHSLGIVHRDLKPSNVFIARRADHTPLVKILDFGISKVNPQGDAKGRAEDQNLTASGYVLGSPAYMSPEQIRSAKGTDARSDIWAIGVILYEVLTGLSPFAGETMGDILAKIVSEPPRPLNELRRDVPPALAALIGRCLERNVAHRVQSVGELAVGLLPFAPRGSEVLVERIRRISAPNGGAMALAQTSAAGVSVQAASNPGAAPYPTPGQMPSPSPGFTPGQMPGAPAGHTPGQIAMPGGPTPPGYERQRTMTAGVWQQAETRTSTNSPRRVSRTPFVLAVASILAVLSLVAVGVVRTRASEKSLTSASAEAPFFDASPGVISAATTDLAAPSGSVIVVRPSTSTADAGVAVPPATAHDDTPSPPVDSAARAPGRAPHAAPDPAPRAAHPARPAPGIPARPTPAANADDLFERRQ